MFGCSYYNVDEYIVDPYAGTFGDDLLVRMFVPCASTLRMEVSVLGWKIGT